jgi:hypothetical protein
MALSSKRKLSMKAIDLMIGDYVKYQEHIYIIEEISAKGWVHLIHPKTKIRVNLTSDYIIDLLEPVQLTPEILKLNGFNECSTEVYTYRIEHETDISVYFSLNAKEGESKIVVSINSLSLRKDGSNLLHTCDINYIHEFQHALKLLRLNNLADIFKVKNNQYE